MAQSIFRRNFERFLGLNQAATDITRPFEFADEITNVRHTRQNSLEKRAGAQAQSRRQMGAGRGLHVHEFAKDPRVLDTGTLLPSSGANVSYSEPTGETTYDWSNPSNITADNTTEATRSFSASVEYSNWLLGTDFGFDIPTDAYITGGIITINSYHSASVTNGTDLTLGFTKDGGTTITEVDRPISVSNTTATSNTDVIGQESFLFKSPFFVPSVVNSSDFGMAIRAYRNGSLGDPGTLEVDYFSLILYYRPVIAETQRELLSLGDNLFRRKVGTFQISYSGSGNGSFSFLPREGGGYRAALLEQGLPLAGWPKDYSIGSSSDTISSLYEDIDGESSWSVTATPLARVNGTVANSTSIPVDSATRTFVEGDRIGLLDEATGVEVWRQIYEVGSGSPPTLELDLSVTISDNEWLGLNREPISSIPITEPTTIPTGSSLTLSVPYLEGVSNIITTSTHPETSDQPLADSSFSGNISQRNASFVDARDVCYFPVPFFSGRGARGEFVNGEIQYSNTGLWKYDGLHTYGAGLPMPYPYSTAAGCLTGGSETYKYRLQYTYKDFRGNQVYGPVTTEEIVVSSAADPPEIRMFIVHVLDQSVFPVRYALMNNSGTNNTIPVDEGHSLLPGMTVGLIDDGDFVERQVTAVTKDSITVDGEAIQYNWNYGSVFPAFGFTRFISMIRLILWRTEANGSIFYYAGEYPVGSYETYPIDTTPDSSLGERLVYPDRQPTPFPKMSFLTSHQGLLVGSGNPEEPEAVYFEDGVNPESSPDATSNFKVVGGGRVTAIGSDNDDMLAVFKDRNYFNVVGDLDTISFQVLEVAKGEYGCPGHGALVKAKNSLIFPSETGFKVISGGQLVSSFEDRLISDFSNNFYTQVSGQAIASENEDKLVIKRAIATYDENADEYICYIPCESGTPEFGGSLRPNANSQIFVYNFGKQSWVKWELDNDYNMAGGVTVFDGQLWWQSRVYDSSDEVVRGQLFKLKNYGSQYDYSDEDSAITSTIRFTWDAFDNPSSFFRVIFLKLFQFRSNDFVTSFDWNVNEYRNFDESTKYTQAVRTFSSSSEKEKRIKFRSGKVQAVSLEFLNENIFEKSILTGYEYTATVPYVQDARAGRSS